MLVSPYVESPGGLTYICWDGVHLLGHTPVTGGLVSDGLLGAAVLALLQGAVISPTGSPWGIVVLYQVLDDSWSWSLQYFD